MSQNPVSICEAISKWMFYVHLSRLCIVPKAFSVLHGRYSSYVCCLGVFATPILQRRQAPDQGKRMEVRSFSISEKGVPSS